MRAYHCYFSPTPLWHLPLFTWIVNDDVREWKLYKTDQKSILFAQFNLPNEMMIGRFVETSQTKEGGIEPDFPNKSLNLLQRVLTPCFMPDFLMALQCHIHLITNPQPRIGSLLDHVVRLQSYKSWEMQSLAKVKEGSKLLIILYLSPRTFVG